MFKKNTLFVIGAGASAEFKFPIGRELSEIISQESLFKFKSGRLVKGNYDTLSWIDNRYPDASARSERLAALKEISNRIFMADSIDNFIDMHANEPHISEMGKLQIAIAIAKKERSSKLFFETNDSKALLDLKKLQDTWIDSFSRILFEKTPKENITDIGENVSIICFNYDRCIEFYLIEAIRQTYIGVSYAQAHEIVSSMKIIHPYGTLGELPNNLHARDGGVVPFGGEVGEDIDPWPVSERLKTYTEQIEDVDMLTSIQLAMEMAKQIIFLGFAFNPQNMKLLSLPDGYTSKSVFSTGKGISPQETDEISSRIVQLYNPIGQTHGINYLHIEENSTCAELMNMHRRNLSDA